MAENDIELNVGIKLDEAQFTQEYKSKLKEISKVTRTQVQGAMDDISGTAAKQWGPLPFAGMHDPSSGNTVATQAFIASLAHDLPNSGYSVGSAAYESALINATYRSSMSDPMQRYHRLLASGLTQQADLTHPDTSLGKAIETDYTLMSQPWSRDFIRQGDKGAYVDFAGMREYAVSTGLGKWVEEDGGNTAENFEFIDEELEKIEDKSKKTKKEFLDWGDALKGALGTLTAIAAIGIKAFEVAYKSSETHTIQAGGELDKRRAFIGMSALDELKTKVASRSIGLGEDSIKNEIYSMSDAIQQYKLLGQGDALPPSLLGIFDNLMNSDTPYETYKASADELYNRLKAMPAEERQRSLMLMNKMGLGTMSSLIGQFLSNEDYAKQYGTPSALFNLETNPYYNVYNRAETMLPELSKLNESLKASYNQMYTDWEETFGVKFKSWWDDTLKSKVVPWFETILKTVGYTTSEEGKEEDAFYKAWNKKVKAQVEQNKPKNIEELNLATGAWSLAASNAIAIGGTYWRDFTVSDAALKSSDSKAAVNRLKGVYNPDESGQYDYKPKEFLAGLKVLADASKYKKGALDPNSKNYDREASTMQSRASLALDWLTETGFSSQLGGNWNTTTSWALIKVLREYLMSPKSEGTQTLDSYLTETYLQTPGWKNIVEPFLRAQAEYLRGNEQAVREIKVTLFNTYGERIESRVDEIVYGDNSSLQR